MGVGGRVSGVRWGRWLGAGAGFVVGVLVAGWLGSAAVTTNSASASEGGFQATVQPVSSVTQIDPTLTAAATAASIGQEARALTASTAEWATAGTRGELEVSVSVLEQELARTIPVLDSAARIDADLAGVMDALAGVRAEVVATASKILDTETPGAEASVRETLRAAIADHQADGPATRETMGTLASLISAGTAARESQTAYVAEQERLAAEAAAKAAAEAAAAAATAESAGERRSANPTQPTGAIQSSDFTERATEMARCQYPRANPTRIDIFTGETVPYGTQFAPECF